MLQAQPVVGYKVSVRAMAASSSQDASASTAAAAGLPGALGCMSVPEALDVWDTSGVWTLPGRPPIIAEHPEYQLTGSKYPSERRPTGDIIPAPV